MASRTEAEPTGHESYRQETVVPLPSADAAPTRVTLPELESAIRAADPAVRFVPPRILRRVIKHDRGLTGFGLHVPHRKGYVVSREALLRIADREELGDPPDAELPEHVILLARPSPQRLADSTAQDMLLRYWRLLFHARVHLALDTGLASTATPAEVRGRIETLGRMAFDEIRTVLDREGMLLPPRSELSVYIEFAATYLELRHFAPSFLSRYFPALTDLDAVDSLLRRDVDAETLLATTRPPGAAGPRDVRDWDQWADLPPNEEGSPVEAQPPQAEAPSLTKYRRLMQKSQRPATVGNVVRTAIWHARAARCAPAELVARTAAALKADAHRMAARLQAALEEPPSGAQPWEKPLLALLSQTPRGIWTIEARLLYDLQKACVDHEREVYTVDLVEWALSLGRRPIRRRLPSQRDVLMLRHLRTAARRLDRARISERQRRQLARLLRSATEKIERKLREHLRPRIVAALDTVGLLPRNLPERVAHKKLVEELLDRIADRGFLAIGDLRDAISRNNLKLPDLVPPLDCPPSTGLLGRMRQTAACYWRGAVNFVRGDELLRANRRLALTLDGVYRRGEVYMRWLQRLSSTAFGTAVGRFLTRFLMVPFGGAFVAVVGVVEIWGLLVSFAGSGSGVTMPEVDAAGHAVPHKFELTEPQLAIIVVLGLFLLGVVNSAKFRAMVAGSFKAAFSAFRLFFVEPIRWLARSSLVQRFLHGRLFRTALRFLIKPALWTAVLWCLLRVMPIRDAAWRSSIGAGASTFLAVNLLLNSRWGRNAEELAAEWLVLGWHRFGVRLIVSVFWFFVDLFRSLVESVERLIYSVDEWLRFRTGENRFSLGAKAVIGAFWFFVAYLMRFAVNVLIEPQINPIKHFPVVTVAHKLLLGVYIPFATLLEKTMDKPAAWTAAITIIWCIPGIFGFLVWELKENWRLYAANRRRGLGPVMIGSHGETMGRLLRPGFHSGTLPKRFAKLRLAERHARSDGGWRAVHKSLRLLEHVERSLRRYVEREFLELFAQSRTWQQPSPEIEEIYVSTNSVRVSLRLKGAADASPLRIVIDAELGWLLAGIDSSGWAERLSPQERQMLTTALVGLYKTSGIELIRQQLEAEFSPPCPPYDLTAEGLVVWPDERESVEVLYDLREGPWIAPQSVRGLARRRLPTIERRRILFTETIVAWDRWVAIWEQDAAGLGHARDAAAPIRLLPASDTRQPFATCPGDARS
ncbi:MAG: hypothetical protein ABFC96_04715 [Thermoguttaceae bacterium]